MTCKHEHLTFGSGGYYIFCMDCWVKWVAILNTDRDFDLDYSRGNDGINAEEIRVKK
jgi:hypothetical protein